MKTAILYARVARADQGTGQGSALQRQVDELKAFCLKNEIEVAGIYFEVASGSTFERKRFQELLGDLKSGKVKADVILVTRWDRFSRSFEAALEMVKQLFKLNVRVRSIQDIALPPVFFNF